MQFSESWLRTLVDPPLTTAALAHLLTMSGLEVEACEPVAPAFSGVVVGEVRAVEKHPNADRLRVCQVDVGSGRMLDIVCGAPNVVAGMKAPCAVVGATLPGEAPDRPMHITAATMRGVQSSGMLCSARELKLSDDHSGLLALDAGAPIGTDLRKYLDLDDHIFTIKLTPNRADCLSVLGVAREVAALTGAPLKPPLIVAVPKRNGETFPIKISSVDGCGRFTGRVIRNVNAAAPTPEWMRRRLERSGQRSISALVDVTNYVMLELGRPLHVYDLDKLSGGIDVRFGRPGESVKLLNEQTVELEPDVLAITDASGVIGLAGIMGGESTKAEPSTHNVVLEAAFFFPDAIAGRARRYKFTSDASHRFERGVDYDNNIAGIERATQLILDICGGDPGPVTDHLARLPERKPVRMRAERARKVIGVPIPLAEMQSIFSRLGLAHEKLAEDVLQVKPPSYRFDLEIEEDLIEEVARVYGFDKLPALPPLVRSAMRSPPEAWRSLHSLRKQLAALDYQEVLNFSFVEPQWEQDFAGNSDPIRLLNPITSQSSVMRSSLLPGLVANVRYNLDRRANRVRVFEIGRVFLRAPGAPEGPLDVAGIRQPMRIAAAAFGPIDEEQWGEVTRDEDFYDLKGDLEMLLGACDARFEPAQHHAFHPGRSASVLIDGKVAGWIGELHPRLQQKYEVPGPLALFEIEAQPLQTQALPRYHPVPKVPIVTRDLAMTFPDDILLQSIFDDLEQHKPPQVDSIRLFDVYRGPGVENGRKSLAFRVLLQDTQKTMTDPEVESAVAQLVLRLERQFNGKLRD
jgi:phenylalanyl-tRNA synthetase beta chain